MVVGSLFLIATCSVEAADVTITDGIDDVSIVDYFTGETNVVTSHPDITVGDIDLIKATYTQQGQQATVSLQVKEDILDRGQIIDIENPDLTTIDTVEYGFQIYTSEQQYIVTYSNKTGQVNNGEDTKNLTADDFTVDGDTLTMRFTLISATEEYESLNVTTQFIKVDFSDIGENPSDFVYLSDIAPNPQLAIYYAEASNLGSVGETIQFNGSVEPFTGQPPYNYRWDFGDEATSTALNPTHVYTKTGTFTYTFTVTDQAGDSASETGTITISQEGGSNGSQSNQMILFLAILLIVIVVGIVIIVWIIRR